MAIRRLVGDGWGAMARVHGRGCQPTVPEQTWRGEKHRAGPSGSYSLQSPFSSSDFVLPWIISLRPWNDLVACGMHGRIGFENHPKGLHELPGT